MKNWTDSLRNGTGIKSGNADLVCILADASQLERSMYMTAEFAPLRKPAVLLLNMMDVAKGQQKEIDHELLSERLGIPVLPFTAAESKGYGELKKLLAQELAQPNIISSAPDVKKEHHDDSTSDSVKDDSGAKFEWIGKMLDGVTSSAQKEYRLSTFDRIATAPFWGKLLSIGVILLAFLVAMVICIPFMGIGSMLPGLMGPPIADTLGAWNVHPWLVSIFSLIIPNVLYFSLSMAAFVLGVNIVFGFLEEIGFLARAAYQFDGVLSRLGLQGKAICPMLMGFGCTIGGHGQLGTAYARHGSRMGGAVRFHLVDHTGHIGYVLHSRPNAAGMPRNIGLHDRHDVAGFKGFRQIPLAKGVPHRHDHGAAALSQGPLEAYSQGGFPEGLGHLPARAGHGHAGFAALLRLLLQR